MIAVRAMYKDGKIEPIEPVPEIKSAEVLIIFPDAPQENKDAASEEKPTPEELDARLFGSVKDWWTDEVDQAVRDSWRTTPRKRNFSPEGENLLKDGDDVSI